MTDSDENEPSKSSNPFMNDFQLGKMLESFNNSVPKDHPEESDQPAWYQLFRAMCFAGVGYSMAYHHAYMCYVTAALAKANPEWFQQLQDDLPISVIASAYYIQIEKALTIVREFWPRVQEFEHLLDDIPKDEGLFGA